MSRKIKILIVIVVLIIIGVIIIRGIINKSKKGIVCIDAGHGGIDVGANDENRYEKNDTLKVARLVREYLEEEDIKVIMTRTDDKTCTLQERCKIANKKKANLFVSLHRNSADTGNGIEIWINSKRSKKDINLATNIMKYIEKTKIQNDRGIKYGTIKGENTDYYVLNNTKMPSCLIELGFISDEEDNKLFDENIKNYAEAISKGIIETINNK